MKVVLMLSMQFRIRIVAKGTTKTVFANRKTQHICRIKLFGVILRLSYGGTAVRARIRQHCKHRRFQSRFSNLSNLATLNLERTQRAKKRLRRLYYHVSPMWADSLIRQGVGFRCCTVSKGMLRPDRLVDTTKGSHVFFIPQTHSTRAARSGNR